MAKAMDFNLSEMTELTVSPELTNLWERNLSTSYLHNKSISENGKVATRAHN